MKLVASALAALALAALTMVAAADDGALETSTIGPKLGVVAIGLTPELRELYGAPRGRGVVLARVVPGSPAARAGLHVGDVVVSVHGETIADPEDVIFSLSEQKPGEMFPIVLVRDRETMVLFAALPRNSDAGAPHPIARDARTRSLR